jgi:hypothetical protein
LLWTIAIDLNIYNLDCMKDFIFDGASENLQKSLDINANGGKVLCPQCRAELIIIANRSEANQKGCSPGILCPINRKHMELAFALQEDFLVFDRWREKMEEKGYFKSKRNNEDGWLE